MAGLNTEALDLIESVLSERAGPSRVEVQLDPMLRNLHDEPRWQNAEHLRRVSEFDKEI